jgi:hypothetical protein
VQGCFLVSIAQVKVQCFVTGDMLISKLNRWFVDFKLMNALGIVYPQFWMELDVGFCFSLNINVIKKHYYELKRINLHWIKL